MAVQTDRRHYTYRILSLIIDVGGHMYRTILTTEAENTYGTVQAFLSHSRSLINNRGRRLNLISKSQFDVMFPNNSAASSADGFDMMLLTFLLRNICPSFRESKTWQKKLDTLPPNDLSDVADLVRIREYRNKFVHRVSNTKTAFTENTFNDLWNDITEVIYRLQRTYNVPNLNIRINEIRNEALDNQREEELKPKKEQFKTELQRWEEMDHEMMKSIVQESSDINDMPVKPEPTCPSNLALGGRLGRGAFGEVFLCFDKDTGRDLAVKKVKLHSQNAKVSKEESALKNEMSMLQNLQHERIVQYYGYSSSTSEICIFMEYMPGVSHRHRSSYIPGGSISDTINKHGSLKEPEAAKYTQQVLEGLVYLHENGIVHRDIKGANVLRDRTGNVKLADFGISKRLQTIGSVSGHKSFPGTPHWMAPELIRGETYGVKVDIWSVGCTLVEMLTKEPPWAELEPCAAIYKIGTEDFPQFTLPNDLSPCVDDFLRLTFKRIPGERPSAEDLLLHSFVLEGQRRSCTWQRGK
ncbi:mitogen-activated protein kinase kinase kinase 2-like isoform X2 [Mercenaria mercenaria]|uniref:mitogen-activated protein kinase kinase kinase 2-like isoform X2 n=1 Tax=Mercenaria mercenaria TaxID=6596 RepID=UPI00234F6FEC|nr:mitogen-activated protein kinase kinase kinase 2-like isoform X2 [Mercenaria mercenaria]